MDLNSSNSGCARLGSGVAPLSGWLKKKWPSRSLGALGIAVVVRDVGPRQVVCDDVTDAAHVLRHLRERAQHEDQHPAPVVPLERGGHRPVGARRVTVELVDPRRALEVVPARPPPAVLRPKKALSHSLVFKSEFPAATCLPRPLWHVLVVVGVTRR